MRKLEDLEDEIRMAMPLGMMASMVITVGYAAPYGEHKKLAAEVPTPKTVVVPDFYVERFIEEAKFSLGLEEYTELPELVSEYIPDIKGWCPYVINSMHIDERCGVRVFADEIFDDVSQFPSYKGN
jgi:hypothetical protein